MEEQSLYKAFTVGYLGDYAGVTCHLAVPIIGTSSRPKDKWHRETFTVETSSHIFNRKSLVNRIREIEFDGRDITTLEFLKTAQTRLENFIDLNGETNPNEAIDWERIPA